jgi:SAM-dependent methyltransferase
MEHPEPLLDRHNIRQRSYFESTVKRTMVPTRTPYLERHVDQMLRFARISPPDRVMEVGCGMGRYTLMLAERGIDITGMDLSPVLLDRLRAFADGQADMPLYSADVLDPPAELRHQFDAVIGFFTLHHLHDLGGCFSSMTQLLREGGRVAFLEPNALNPLYYLQIALTPRMTWRGDGGVARMLTHVVLGAMRKAGLVDLRVRRFGFFPPFIANRRLGGSVESYLERFPLWRPFLPFQLFGGAQPRSSAARCSTPGPPRASHGQ